MGRGEEGRGVARLVTLSSRGHQRSSEVIRGHRRSSVVVTLSSVTEARAFVLSSPGRVIR